MKALILRSDADAAVSTARVLVEKGFQILCVESYKIAYALVRLDTIDLLVMDEKIDGQLTHSLALSGERRNPYLSAIILTDRIGRETDDLYSLIPCLHALVGSRTPAALLGQLAVASVDNMAATAARVALNAQIDSAEAAEIDTSWDGADPTAQFGATGAAEPVVATPRQLDSLVLTGDALNDENDDAATIDTFKPISEFVRHPLPYFAQAGVNGDAHPFAKSSIQ